MRSAGFDGARGLVEGGRGRLPVAAPHAPTLSAQSTEGRLHRILTASSQWLYILLVVYERVGSLPTQIQAERR